MAGNAALLVLLDLSVARHTINHDILLGCLQGLGIDALFCNGSALS